MTAPGAASGDQQGLRFVAADPTLPPASGLLAAMEAEMLALYGPGGCGVGVTAAPAATPADGAAPAADTRGGGAAPGGQPHIGVPLEAGELAPPTGVYLVGWAGGEPVAGGGLRTIAPGIGEVKRMYVVPSWRGRGIGPRLLAALEAHAAGLGLAATRLDTGPKQAGAQRIYERAGYRPVGNYNANPHASFWGEKSLSG
ncbi:MAG TPA: GNAT family N-acetyltransferase [Acidimicrobiales bacterium]|nr:GNAT family N-acetyltransferase [Acidimicrobiales bacterium]